MCESFAKIGKKRIKATKYSEGFFTRNFEVFDIPFVLKAKYPVKILYTKTLLLLKSSLKVVTSKNPKIHFEFTQGTVLFVF